jgi:hypothetical protein
MYKITGPYTTLHVPFITQLALNLHNLNCRINMHIICLTWSPTLVFWKAECSRTQQILTLMTFYFQQYQEWEVKFSIWDSILSSTTSRRWNFQFLFLSLVWVVLELWFYVQNNSKSNLNLTEQSLNITFITHSFVLSYHSPFPYVNNILCCNRPSHH